MAWHQSRNAFIFSILPRMCPESRLRRGSKIMALLDWFPEIHLRLSTLCGHACSSLSCPCGRTMFECILVLSYFLAVSFSWVSPELRIDAQRAVPYFCFPVSFSTLLTGKCIRNCLYLNWLSNKSHARGHFERWSWQIPVVVILSQSAQFQWLTANVSLFTPAKRVENQGSPWLVSGNSSAPIHALLPQWCVPVRRLRMRTSPYWQNCVNIGLILHRFFHMINSVKNLPLFYTVCIVLI